MTARRSAHRPIALLALCLHVAACASGRAGAGRPLQLTVGRATRPDLVDKVPRILDQRGYQVAEREDNGNVVRFTTSWVTREPFDDEAGRGASECRTRLIVEGRQQAGTYLITLKAENMMHRQAFDGDWVALAPTTTFREHLRDVSDALALEVDMGVRTR